MLPRKFGRLMSRCLKNAAVASLFGAAITTVVAGEGLAAEKSLPALVGQALQKPPHCLGGGRFLTYDSDTDSWGCSSDMWPSCDDGYIVERFDTTAGVTTSSYECKPLDALLARPDCTGATPVAQFDMAAGQWSCSAINAVNQSCPDINHVLTTDVNGVLSCVDKDRISALAACNAEGNLVQWDGSSYVCLDGTARWVNAAGDRIPGNLTVANDQPYLELTDTDLASTSMGSYGRIKLMNGALHFTHNYSWYHYYWKKWISYERTALTMTEGRAIVGTAPVADTEVLTQGYFENNLSGGAESFGWVNAGEDAYTGWTKTAVQLTDGCPGSDEWEPYTCGASWSGTCLDSDSSGTTFFEEHRYRTVVCQTRQKLERITSP